MNIQKLRVLLIGSYGEYTMKPLEAVAGRHHLAGVVESAPRNAQKVDISHQAGPLYLQRLNKTGYSLRFYAWKHRLPYLLLSNRNMDELREMILDIQPDIVCVASMNQMVPAGMLCLPHHGFVNFHPSLLPKFRGPSVWFWYYHTFEKEGGATIHYLDEGEDTGDIIRQRSFPIDTGMPPGVLMQKTIELGAELMAEVLDDIASGVSTRRQQKHLPCPVRARYLKPGEELFDWHNWSLEHTYHFLQGAYPWYESFKRPVFLPSFYEWRARGYEECSVPLHSAGKIRPDRKGFYFSHPAGKVRLSLQIESHWLVLLFLLLLAVLNILFNR